MFVCPSSLMARIFKAKYFKDSDVLSAHLGSRPSFAWRSIWKAGCMLKHWMRVDPEGSPIWMLGEHGEYSVRSAYTKLREMKEARLAITLGECSDKGEIRRFWRAVWRLRIQSKIKIFIWRLFYDALPTAVNLSKRGIEVDLNCCICGFKEESVEHTFAKCWWARALWDNLGLVVGEELSHVSRIQEWLWVWFKRSSAEKFALFSYGAYLIWRNRNLIRAGQRGLDTLQSSNLAKGRVSLFNKAGFKFSVIGDDEVWLWKAPKGKTLKINCDGSFRGELNKAGVGMVVRDSFGCVKIVYADFQANVASSIEAEGLALLRAIRWAISSDEKELIIETDCAEAFSLIQRFSECSGGNRGWVAECADALARSDGWSLSLVRREANSAADFLARKAVFEGWSWQCSSVIPSGLEKFL